MGRNTLKLIDERMMVNINSLNINSGLLKGEFQGVGYLLKARTGNFIESIVLGRGIWEPHVAEMISSYVQNDEIVIDVGANIGASTIPLAKQYPDTLFYLFEPHPEVFGDLLENICLNRLKNIHSFNNAIMNENEVTIFHAQDMKKNINMGLSSVKLNRDIGEHAKINVNAIRLDDFFKNIDKRVCVIKIDTQGSELDVLKSARNVIRKFRPAVIFEFESEYFVDDDERRKTSDSILKYFEDLDYRTYAMQRESNYLPEITLRGYYNGDILALPVR
jgi:FkbM family methyltransferase